jgi:hypothetical protein
MLQDFLIEAQAFPRWQDGFACFTCAKVLPRVRFANAQTKHKRGRNGGDQKRRFCVQCGIEKGFYVPGNMVVQGDVTRIVCRQCKKLRGGTFCKSCAICAGCDRQLFTLKDCVNQAGRKIVGDTFAGARRGLAPPVLSTKLDPRTRESAYEDATEQMASLEWYDV